MISAINNINLSKRCDIPNFCAVDSKDTNKSSDTETSADKFIKSIENMPPVAVGLSSAMVWFGVGFIFDRLLGCIFKSMKSSMKSSMILNSVFGVAMGVVAYMRAKNEKR